MPARDQRGMVLVMTLLMLTVLTVLAGAAVLRTALELREGGAQRLETAAYQLSETGTMATLTLASQLQASFRDYAANKTASTLTAVDMGPDLLQLAGTDGSFGQELAAVGPVGFQTLVSPAELTAAQVGYDVNRYCFHTYRVLTTSQIGPGQAASPADAALAGQAALAAQMVVGPVQCAP